MNRPFFSSASNSSNNRQPLAQAPPPRPSIHDRFHSRNSSDPHEYHRRPPPVFPDHRRYEEEDTEDAEEEEDDDSEMTQYGSRSGLPGSSANNGSSRPGSSGRESAPASKKPKTKSNKVFQCTGYGDCTMQFTRSEHLARHIRKHTGERPFHCDCGRNFSRLDNLRQHMTTVHAQQYPPPSSNAPPARQPPQGKPSPNLPLTVPPRPNFKNKHRPGPLTLPAQGYRDRSPPGSPRFKSYSATAATFPVTYHDPPPSPLATASGNFSGTNSSWHRPQSALPAIGPLSGGSSSSSAASSSSYFSGHLSPPATGTFPPSPNTAYFPVNHSATYLPHNQYPPPLTSHPSYDEKSSRRQSWHEGSNGNKLPSIRTIWTGEENDHHRPPYSPNNFHTSYMRSPVSSKDDPRSHAYSPVSSRRSSLPHARPPPEHKIPFNGTPEEDEDYPMRNGHDPNTPSSVEDGDAMEVDSKKITSIADLCHPDRGRTEPTRLPVAANTGMDLLSQAAAALIDH